MEAREIKKIDVDTTEAEQRFCDDVLKKDNNGSYRTFFLNGIWGSGKTSFLKKCEENEDFGFASKNKKWKVRYLKLWEISEDRSVIQLAFQTMFPTLNKLLNIITVVSIVISLLLTPTFNLGLEDFIPSFSKIIIVIFALSVSVFKVLKLKSDFIYIQLLDIFSKRSNRILVIDDFDRLSEEKQLESYKLFNVIHGDIPVIFVGEWDKLLSSNDGKITERYLSKFVDRNVELPVCLSPFEMSKSYSRQIIDICGGKEVVDGSKFEQFLGFVFVSDSYSLRELDHFVELLNDELKDRGGSVQIPQLIVILYLYVFFPKLYNQLRKNYRIENNRTFFDDYYDTNENKKNEYIHSRKQVYIESILFDSFNDEFPQSFFNNPIAYFINDNIRNLSSGEAEQKYRHLLNYQDSDLDDISYLFFYDGEFLLYLRNKIIPSSEIDKVANFILKTIDKNDYSDLNKILFNRVSASLVQEIVSTEESNQRIINYWETKLADYSDGKKFNVYRKLNVTSLFYDNLKKQAKDYLESCLKDNEKIDYPSDIAYFLLEGNCRNMLKENPELTKLYNKMDKDEVLKFLESIGLYNGDSIFTEISIYGEVNFLEVAIRPILEIFPDLEELIYDKL